MKIHLISNPEHPEKRQTRDVIPPPVSDETIEVAAAFTLKRDKSRPKFAEAVRLVRRTEHLALDGATPQDVDAAGLEQTIGFGRKRGPVIKIVSMPVRYLNRV